MRKVLYLALAALISGCAQSAEDVIPQDGPTMVDLYNNHLRGPTAAEKVGDALDEARHEASSDSAGGQVGSYTRTAANEIENLFPTLENPNLVMYVFPHLTSGERLPVPGYSTSFPLFDRTEFALPGETAVAEKAPKSRIRILSDGAASSAIRTY